MQMLNLRDSLYEGFLTPERNLEIMREGSFSYHSLLFVEKCFSDPLENLKYYAKVIACLFYLDEAFHCLGKIHEYCFCQQK